MTDFEDLHQHIDQWQTGVVPLPALHAALSHVLDAHAELLGERVVAYRAVLSQLHMRIEAATSFNEESCSFSQADFAGSLHEWLVKLQARLQA
jgi:hypothetical protein